MRYLPHFLMQASRAIVVSCLLVTHPLLFGATAHAELKTARMPPVRISSINFNGAVEGSLSRGKASNEGIPRIAPGSRLELQVGLFLAKSWSDQGRRELGIAWYLLPTNLEPNEYTVRAQGTYIGKSGVRSIPVGESVSDLRVPVVETLPGVEGTFSLIAWLDPTNAVFGKGVPRVFKAPFAIEVAPVSVEAGSIEIAAFEPDRLSVVTTSDSGTLLEGTVAVEALQSDARDIEISLCAVFPGASADQCTPLEVLNPKGGVFGASYPVPLVEKDEVVTTMFRAKLPNLATSGDLILRAQVWDGPVGQGLLSDSRERVISSEIAPMAFTRMATDFEKDLNRQLALVRKQLKQRRIKGEIVNPLRVSNVRNSGKKAVKLDEVLARITSSAPTTSALMRTTEPDSYSVPTGLVNSIPGSRFNMPDQDFPWLNNIGVKAPPPPEQYRGTPFPSVTEYNRCIPFFCGPNSPSEAGREPSQSCVRQYCGTTKEDVNFGGRNTNLLDEQIGFDKNFSGGGFGARVGITGRAKVYADKAISDYVAASYETGAFFGVKLFGYSVPIFEASSQSVYSPTEIGNSQTRNELKILGLVIEREDRPSGNLSVTVSKTYGVDKKADVSLGPISVDIKVEAGGTGGVTLAVEQIDILRGIIGSLTPSAGCGAKARAVTDVGIGSFGIQGELDLFEDRVPATATFNVGLDISRKSVTPQLDFDIRNVLEGPNGRIKLVLEIGIPPLSDSFSTTIASFSTGTFETPIYDKTTTFGAIRY